MYENNFRIRFRYVQFNNFRRQKNTLWEADEIDGSQYREKNVTNQETWRNLLKPVDSHWHWKTWHVWQSIHAWNRNILFFSKINFEKRLVLIITGGFIYFHYLKETLRTLFCFIIRKVEISFSLASLPILYTLSLRKWLKISMLVNK